MLSISKVHNFRNNLEIGEIIMFLTWQFWKALRFPMWHNSIFLHARQQQNVLRNNPFRLSRVLHIVLACVVMACILFPSLAIISALFVLVGIPSLLIIFNGTVLGTIWVTSISATIARSHQRYHYDLLSVTPQGAYELSWHMVTGTIHRHNWLRTVYRLLSWVAIVVIVLLGLASFMLAFGLITANDEVIRQAQSNVLRDVINIAFIVVALWIDHIQSIVISALLGMLLPRVIKNRVQLQSLASLIYLVLQAFTYLLILLVYVLSTTIFSGLLGTAFFTSSIIVSLTLGSFFILRETIIRVLVYALQLYYDLPETEVSTL